MTKRPWPPKSERTPVVIAPDIILDLIFGIHDWRGAMMLFDAIAADVQAENEMRPAYIASITVPQIYYMAYHGAGGGPPVASSIVSDLLQLFRVVPHSKEDHLEALWWSRFGFEHALQFAACRRIGANYLVTRLDYDNKQAPVYRRTAGQILPFFRR